MMDNNVIRLENCVIPDMTLDDVNKILEKNFLKKYTFIAWDEMIGETDAAWCLQNQSSLMDMVPFGRMRIRLMWEQNNRATGGGLDAVCKHISEQAAQTARRLLNSQKAFDMIIDRPSIEMKETYGAEVPKTVQLGVFKTKTIYVKEREISYSYTYNSLTFNGWLLAHFKRSYRAFSSKCQRNLNWDFVLGADGKIYHLTYGYTIYDDPSSRKDKNSEFFYTVREAIFYDLCLLNNKNQAYFIAVSHGALLSLNYILEDQSVSNGEYSKTINASDNERYTYNFPLEPTANVKVDINMQNLVDKLNSL